MLACRNQNAYAFGESPRLRFLVRGSGAGSSRTVLKVPEFLETSIVAQPAVEPGDALETDEAADQDSACARANS